MNRLLVLVFGFLIIPAAMGSSTTGAIVSVVAGEVYGNKVFIQMSPKPTTVPGCQTNARYNYVFDPTTAAGQVVLSIILAAYTAHRTVYLEGTEACSLVGDVESLEQVRAL